MYKIFSWITCLFIIYPASAQKQMQENVRPASCFIMKPVAGDSKMLAGRQVGGVTESNALSRINDNHLLSGNDILIDSSVNYVTSFEWQKQIAITYHCFMNLDKPSELGLISIYHNSRPVAQSPNVQITFLKQYRKDITGFGKARVYEYSISNDTNTAEAHSMILLFKDNENISQLDVYGFAFCSDGILWHTNPADGRSFFSLVQRQYHGRGHRAADDVIIPLRLQEVSPFQERFVPVTHYILPVNR